jgi:hypothetical protein
MLNARDKLDRTLLKFGWELSELNKRLHRIVPLAKPIHTGWTRRHVLSPKADHREDKGTLRQILEVIGTVHYSKRRDFRERRKKFKGQLVQVDQPPRSISPSEWLKKQLPAIWKPYFRLETIHRRGKWREEYVFIHRGLFELKIRARYITETYAVDPLVARRIHEIESWLKNHHAMHRLNRLRDIKTGGWPLDYRQRLLGRISQQELRFVLCNPTEVDVTNDDCVGHISFRHIATFIFSPA